MDTKREIDDAMMAAMAGRSSFDEEDRRYVESTAQQWAENPIPHMGVVLAHTRERISRVEARISSHGDAVNSSNVRGGDGQEFLRAFQSLENARRERINLLVTEACILAALKRMHASKATHLQEQGGREYEALRYRAAMAGGDFDATVWRQFSLPHDWMERLEAPPPPPPPPVQGGI